MDNSKFNSFFSQVDSDIKAHENTVSQSGGNYIPTVYIPYQGITHLRFYPDPSSDSFRIIRRIYYHVSGPITIRCTGPVCNICKLVEQCNLNKIKVEEWQREHGAAYVYIYNSTETAKNEYLRKKIEAKAPIIGLLSKYQVYAFNQLISQCRQQSPESTINLLSNLGDNWMFKFFSQDDISKVEVDSQYHAPLPAIDFNVVGSLDEALVSANAPINDGHYNQICHKLQALLGNNPMTGMMTPSQLSNPGFVFAPPTSVPPTFTQPPVGFTPPTQPVTPSVASFSQPSPSVPPQFPSVQPVMPTTQVPSSLQATIPGSLPGSQAEGTYIKDLIGPKVLANGQPPDASFPPCFAAHPVAGAPTQAICWQCSVEIPCSKETAALLVQNPS